MGLPAIESSDRSQDTEVLFREHGAAVARFCRSLLRDHAEAEDAAQQVFLSAHRALLNGSTPREPLPWLLTVARHECYARFRQRRASPVPAGDGHDDATPDASVHVLRAGQIATLWDEVERMPRAQRDAFVLREIRGLSYTQLADELALSAASVRSLLVRARTRLRHRLRDVAPSIGGAPWIQTLVRLVGGEGASPVPAASKAAAIGIGALALVGGGDLARVPHHPSRAAGHAAVRQLSHPRAPRAARPPPVVAAPVEDRAGHDVGGSEVEHARRRGDGSRESHSGSSRDGSGDLGTSSRDGSSSSGHDGSNDTTATTRPTTSGRDGGNGSSGSSGSGRDSSHDGSSESSSGSDNGSSSTTSTTGSSSGGHGSGDSGDGDGSSGSDG